MPYIQWTEAPTYVARFNDIQKAISGLSNSVSTMRLDAQQIVNLRTALLDLEKRVNRLMEDTRQANVNFSKAGVDYDKDVLLVGQGCLAVAFIIEALDNYLRTEDTVFLNLLVDGSQRLTSITKLL